MREFQFVCVECDSASVRIAHRRPKLCEGCLAVRKELYHRRRYPTAMPKVVSVAAGLLRCLTCERDLAVSEFPLDRGRPRRHCRDCHRAKKALARLSEDRSEEYAKRDAVRRKARDIAAIDRRRTDRERSRRKKAIYAKLDDWFAAKLKASRAAKIVATKPWLAAGLTDAERFRIRYNTDPEFRVKELLRQSMRRKRRGREAVIAKTMRRAIKFGTSASSIEAFLGYSAADLRDHLSRLFDETMTWDAFMRGEIHIDHVRPVSSFDLTQDSEIKACWSLSNLQPLWAADNLRKRDHWVGIPANDNGSPTVRAA